MRSDDVDTLQLLVNAATEWRTAALAQNVELNILTTEINNETVILSWNESGYWDIRTQ
jgi:hypothetical protein